MASPTKRDNAAQSAEFIKTDKLMSKLARMKPEPRPKKAKEGG